MIALACRTSSKVCLRLCITTAACVSTTGTILLCQWYSCTSFKWMCSAAAAAAHERVPDQTLFHKPQIVGCPTTLIGCYCCEGADCWRKVFRFTAMSHPVTSGISLGRRTAVRVIHADVQTIRKVPEDFHWILRIGRLQEVRCLHLPVYSALGNF